MSNENKQKQNEEVKEVIEVKQVQEVEETEKKKFTIGPKIKKALKIMGVAAVGVLGYAIGAKTKNKNNIENNYEEVEYEVMDNNENNQ